MRRLVVVMLAAAVTAGCASSPGSAISGRDQTVHLSDGSSSLRIQPNDPMSTATLPYTADAIWNVMPSVFDSLGIAVGTLDPDTRVIGNTALKVHGHLASVALSKYIDCGQTQGFPSADTYDVHLSVLTQVSPGKGSSATVATVVEAVARPAQFKGDYSRCETKGELEARIPRVVTARLQK
jgi:hypothetical protein